MRYTRPNLLLYRLAQAVSWFVAAFVFRRRVLRNEIKGKQGAYVVIANHQAAYDFVNLIGLTRRPMTFVISSSFYNSLPIKGLLDKLGVIPKQQFQTSVQNMKKMKSVIAQGQPLVIYPAGLMCEDGLSTPIPAATYKFLKWLGADVCRWSIKRQLWRKILFRIKVAFDFKCGIINSFNIYCCN